MGEEPQGRIESLVERRIRQAMEEGEFEELPGAGRPLPGAGLPDDDLWWIRGWMERNGLNAAEITRLTGRPPARRSGDQ